ncbi:DNA-3-methyladenine glycosylase family protein [Bacillus marasmi]|uniref:DNA-3-methyladenine glycosylase family protein n=1 Tax=Bacillus marasmi TaxID=1926279 RepID=UPI0011C7A603|nr:DNA-3-methyladenine glycosylase [Bacillus marasmi]
MWQENIKINGPYNFDEVIRRQTFDPLHVLSLNERWVKVPLWIDGTPTAVKVQATGTTESPSFAVSGSKQVAHKKAIDKLTEIFQWNIPLNSVIEHFKKTNLKELFNEHYGAPLVLEFDPYGCLLKCIIHQQLNMAFAHTLSTRFVHTFGKEVDGVWFYPRPEIVAKIKIDQLRELQFSTRKAEYVIGVGKAIVEGQLDLEKLKHMTDEEVLQNMIKLRGVGPWTVQNFLLFGLGRPNLFPIADIGIQNAIKKLFEMDRKPTIEEMEHYKKDWDPYLSYASLYLWRSIE